MWVRIKTLCHPCCWALLVILTDLNQRDKKGFCRLWCWCSVEYKIIFYHFSWAQCEEVTKAHVAFMKFRKRKRYKKVFKNMITLSKPYELSYCSCNLMVTGRPLGTKLRLGGWHQSGHKGVQQTRKSKMDYKVRSEVVHNGRSEIFHLPEVGTSSGQEEVSSSCGHRMLTLEIKTPDAGTQEVGWRCAIGGTLE